MKFVFDSILSSKSKILDYAIAHDGKQRPESKILLAIPPGVQSKAMVHEAYDAWVPYFVKKGWVFVSPIAPKDKLFFQGSEKKIPVLLDELQKRFKPYLKKVHLLGISNGGISAFRLATLNPTQIHSVTVLPGWPKPADLARIGNIKKIPVNLLVGSEDSNWLEKARATHDQLSKIGCKSTLTVIPNGDHFAFRKIKAREIEKIILS